jgi:hypothetical protein
MGTYAPLKCHPQTTWFANTKQLGKSMEQTQIKLKIAYEKRKKKKEKRKQIKMTS